MIIKYPLPLSCSFSSFFSALLVAANLLCDISNYSCFLPSNQDNF